MAEIDDGIWNYGVIREKGKLKIVELYYNNKNKPYGYCYLDLYNLRDLFLIILDIYLQLKHAHVWHEEDIKSNKPDWHKN